MTVPSVRPQPPGESAGPIDPYAPVPVPNKPNPHARSGAVAVPEPDEADDAIVAAVGANNPKMNIKLVQATVQKR